MGETWEPNPGSGRTVEDIPLNEWVGQAMGAASTCWGNLRGAGVFDSERCGRILAALMEHINSVIDGVIVGTTEAVRPQGEALLGLASTRELLREIEVRAAVGRLDGEQQSYGAALLRLEQIASGLLAGMPQAVLDYRTVGS